MTKKLTKSQADIVWDLRHQLGDVTDHVTRKWRSEHVPEVMQAYRAWIAHHEHLREQVFCIIPQMKAETHFVTVCTLLVAMPLGNCVEKA